ncbi:MAG: hypothetical protein ACOCP8_09375 [archaeon]
MRGVAIIAFFWILYIFFIKGFKKLKLKYLIIAVIISALTAYRQIKLYFFVLDGARKLLTITSLIIAKDHFPFGTGFGTYASHISGEYYSVLYSMYGLNNIYGLTKNNIMFISDTFWPMVIAQFGFLGFILVCIVMVLLFLDIWKKKKLDKYNFWASLILFVFMIILSTSNSSFVNPQAVTIFFLLGFYEAVYLYKIKKLSGVDDIVT